MSKSKGPNRPFLVSVEGNIGSGKSTMLKFFDRFQDVQLCPEPVADWCDVDGHNLLGKLYEDPQRWSFQFQSYVQLTRLKIIQEPTESKIKIIERSIQNNRFCFLKMAEKTGSLTREEMAVLNSWHDWLDSTLDLNLDLIVYLRTDPEVSYARMRARNRKEEKSAGLDYLQHLHEAYEDWLIGQKYGPPPAPVLVLDANEGIQGMDKTFERLQGIIRGENPLPGVIVDENKDNKASVIYDEGNKDLTAAVC